jgi:hypothetical protein
MRHCFGKAKNKKKKQATTEGKAKQRRIKILNEERKNHVPPKANSSRLVNSFMNSTMLESSTERPFPVCICWKRRKK